MVLGCSVSKSAAAAQYQSPSPPHPPGTSKYWSQQLKGAGKDMILPPESPPIPGTKLIGLGTIISVKYASNQRSSTCLLPAGDSVRERCIQFGKEAVRYCILQSMSEFLRNWWPSGVTVVLVHFSRRVNVLLSTSDHTLQSSHAGYQPSVFHRPQPGLGFPFAVNPFSGFTWCSLQFPIVLYPAAREKVLPSTSQRQGPLPPKLWVSAEDHKALFSTTPKSGPKWPVTGLCVPARLFSTRSPRWLHLLPERGFLPRVSQHWMSH